MKVEKFICDICGKEKVLPVVVGSTLYSERGTGMRHVEVHADLCHQCATRALRRYMEKDKGVLFKELFQEDIDKCKQANEAKGDI